MKRECQTCIHWEDSGSSFGEEKVNWGECHYNPPFSTYYHYSKQGKQLVTFQRSSNGPSGNYGANEELVGISPAFPKTWGNISCGKWDNGEVKTVDVPQIKPQVKRRRRKKKPTLWGELTKKRSLKEIVRRLHEKAKGHK